MPITLTLQGLLFNANTHWDDNEVDLHTGVTQIKHTKSTATSQTTSSIKRLNYGTFMVFAAEIIICLLKTFQRLCAALK